MVQPGDPRAAEKGMRGSARFGELVCWTERALDGFINNRIEIIVIECMSVDIVIYRGELSVRVTGGPCLKRAHFRQRNTEIMNGSDDQPKLVGSNVVLLAIVAD